MRRGQGNEKESGIISVACGSNALPARSKPCSRGANLCSRGANEFSIELKEFSRAAILCSRAAILYSRAANEFSSAAKILSKGLKNGLNPDAVLIGRRMRNIFLRRAQVAPPLADVSTKPSVATCGPLRFAVIVGRITRGGL